MRGRLGRYAAWQLRDYAFDRGVPTLIVGAFILLQIVMALRLRGPLVQMTEAAARVALPGFLSTISFVATLLAVNGIVATDRKQGYYRFLFAKPVSVPRYYAQSFLVNGVGMVSAVAVILGAFAAWVYPMLPPGALVYAALYYLAAGGVGFLFSVVLRFDWVALAGTWGTAQILPIVYPPGSLLGTILTVTLPPAHRMNEVGTALIHGGAVAPRLLLWIAGYGLVAFAIGLLVLRRRTLAL